jgi:ribonuclease BN (tRNA processing enzyme)
MTALRDDSVRLTVIGCGDAMGSGGAKNTCFLVDDSLGRFTIDFGATSMSALNEAGFSPDTIDLVFLTHLHGDHFGAIPNLLLMREYVSQSVAPLTIAGPPGLEARIVSLCEAMFPGMWKEEWTYPLHIVEIVPGDGMDVLGRRVLTQPVTHYAGPEPSTAIRIETSGCAIGFSGDTGWNDVLIEMAQDTDVFLCDCFDRVDQPFEGHLSYETFAKKAALLNTKRLLMTHLGPAMIHTTEEFEHEAATDGLTVMIGRHLTEK